MSYKVAFGPSQWCRRELIPFEDLESARWMYDMVCESNDPEKSYTEIFFEDNLTKKKRVIERQQKVLQA